MADQRQLGPITNLGYGRRPTMRQGASWFRIENAKTPSPSIYLYDEIGFWGVSAADFATQLSALDVSALTVHINSPGGEVFDGIAIYNALLSHKARITVLIDGLAASAASFIAQAGDEVHMARNAQMMIHDAQGICVGPAEDMERMAEMLGKCSDNIADIYAQRAGGTVASWRTKMVSETWYSAAEAVQAGLADAVIERDAEATNSWDMSIFAHAGREAAPAPVIDTTGMTNRRDRAIIDLAFSAPLGLTPPIIVDDPTPDEPGQSSDETLPVDPIDYAGLAAMFHTELRGVVGALNPLPPADLGSAMRDVFFTVPEVAEAAEVIHEPVKSVHNLSVETWRQLMREVPAQ